MRTIHMTQVYEMTVTVELHVPDYLTSEDDLTSHLCDFPINATVESMWDNEFDGTEIVVGDTLSLDSLVALAGATYFTDENGETLFPREEAK